MSHTYLKKYKIENFKTTHPWQKAINSPCVKFFVKFTLLLTGDQFHTLFSLYGKLYVIKGLIRLKCLTLEGGLNDMLIFVIWKRNLYDVIMWNMRSKS